MSFVGFVPSRKPALAIIVVIDSPRAGGNCGGSVAAPIFQRIAEAALRHLAVPADDQPAAAGPGRAAVREPARRRRPAPTSTSRRQLPIVVGTTPGHGARPARAERARGHAQAGGARDGAAAQRRRRGRVAGSCAGRADCGRRRRAAHPVARAAAHAARNGDAAMNWARRSSAPLEARGLLRAGPAAAPRPAR